MTTEKNQIETATIECLKHAISDTQETIRGYDNKALIVATLITLAVGITNYSLMPHLEGWLEYGLITSWLLAITSVALLGMVLHPRVDNFKAIHLGEFTPAGVYFLHNITNSPSNSVSALAERALSTYWVEELMYESMKVSYIRDKKHCWFILALKVTGLTLALTFLMIILGAFICG